MGGSATGWKGLGAYGRYSGGPRVDRMAAVVAASCDSGDVVCVPEADEAVGRGYYGSIQILRAAVRCGLMRATGLPKDHGGRTYRTTYAATEDGFLWLQGYRRYAAAREALSLSSSAPPPPKRRRRTLPRKRVSLAEASRRVTAAESEALSRAVAGMRERLAERDAERRAREGLSPRWGRSRTTVPRKGKKLDLKEQDKKCVTGTTETTQTTA